MSRHSLRLGELSVEVERWPGTLPHCLPVLLLHEGLGSIGLWKHFPGALASATGREVIAWSRQGHGWSDPISEPRRPDYMHREATLLWQLQEVLGVSRAHWLGHSDGASIALIGAAMHPNLPASLILEAPHVFVEDVTVSSIAHIGAIYRESEMDRRMKRYHADPDHIFSHWNDIWLNPDFRAWNIEELLEKVVAPALLIQGCDDEYGTLEQLDRIEAALTETERLELTDCGHSPHRDREEAVISAVCRFLKGRD